MRQCERQSGRMFERLRSPAWRWPFSPAWRRPPMVQALEYNRDIRPILAENCFPCHGPDSAARKADLRLDRREAAVEAGAIVARRARDERAGRADHRQTTPRRSCRRRRRTKTLDARRRKRLLKRWIAAGRRVSAALVVHRAEAARACPRSRTQAWVRNPIDRFMLAKLEANGLHPAPEADRRTLARRLSLDLTGLPPEPAESSRRSSTTPRPTPTRSSSTGCSPRRNGASTAPATGSTPPAMPTPTASTSTTTARSGRIATGSSTPSTATCRSTSSRSSNWPATCCPAARSTSRWPRASTAATSRPARAGRSTRSTSSSTPATAPRRPRRSGWG